MKQTLAYDRQRKQYRCDIGTPQRRFHLGSDPEAAAKRKQHLAIFWKNIEKRDGWTERNIELARTIASGQPLVDARGTDKQAQAAVKDAAAKLKGIDGPVQVRATVTMEDALTATIEQQSKRITELETLIREKLGQGAVDGPSVSIHQAIDQYIAYRTQTEIDPQTGETTDGVRGEANRLRVAKRVIDDAPISTLSWTALSTWAKAIAARPVCRKTGRPIRWSTAVGVLKVLRAWIRWASRNYGWRKPEDWKDATLVRVRKTDAERAEAIEKIQQFFTLDEIGILWKHALPSERILLMGGLNFGYGFAELKRLKEQEIKSGQIVALRGKTGALGKWYVWPETAALADHIPSIPKRRQNVANRWTALLKRIRKSHPDFKPRSFKWLRNSGASHLRQIAGGEIASLYLSHGEAPTTNDELLEVYAAPIWEKLTLALKQFGEELRPKLVDVRSEHDQRTQIPIAMVEKIQNLWKEGKNWKEIKKETGLSTPTIYRYRPE